jgi:hypothetical protein
VLGFSWSLDLTNREAHTGDMLAKDSECVCMLFWCLLNFIVFFHLMLMCNIKMKVILQTNAYFLRI